MITKELFGLVQCYTEQGTCYFNDFNFNIMFMPIIYIAFFGLLIGLLSFIVYMVKFKSSPPIV